MPLNLEQLAEWWRWVRKINWELLETIPTDYTGMLPNAMNPYFWLVWRDNRTGKVRTVPDY